MKTLVTADLHLSEQPVNAYRLTFLKRQLPQLLDKHRIDRLVIAGDITEEKDRHTGWLTTQMVDIIGNLADIAEVLIIEGNHDFIDIEYPFFRFLDQLNRNRRIRWIKHPTIIDDMLLLPHTSDYKKDWAKLAHKSKLIITHNTFDGATSERGGKLKGIPLGALPNVPIISGDVHQPQKLKNLQYVGPPYTVYFGDDFDPRVLIIDDKWNITSHPTNAARKRQIDADHPVKASDFRNCMANDIIKLRIGITQQEQPRWAEIRDAARSLAVKKGFHIFAVQPVVRNIKSRSTSKLDSTQHKSDTQLIKDYCRRRNVDQLTEKRGIGFASSAAAVATAPRVRDEA